MSLSPQQRAALELVRAGRVQYGIEHPEMARRARARGRDGFDTATWIVDGFACDGRQNSTFQSLEERGLITVRMGLVPTVYVPGKTRVRRRMLGGEESVVVPAHRRPADPGWRAPVELAEESVSQ